MSTTPTDKALHSSGKITYHNWVLLSLLLLWFHRQLCQQLRSFCHIPWNHLQDHSLCMTKKWNSVVNTQDFTVCSYLIITLEVIKSINKACCIWILLKTTNDKRKIVVHMVGFFFQSSATYIIPFSLNNMENRTFFPPPPCIQLACPAHATSVVVL